MWNMFSKLFGKRNSFKNIIQPFPFREGFETKKVFDDGTRAPLSRERKIILEQVVLETEKLFRGSSIHWEIDGGLSVSLLRGQFIGEHRDLDVAVEESELEQLQKIIEAKGYGLFVTLGTEKRETMHMKRVDWKEFSEAPTFLFWIIAVDKNGLIRKDLALSFINVHIIKRSEKGLPFGEEGVELPAHWFRPRVINFLGSRINVASPLKTAYYKLQSIRNYDLTDLRHMFESGLISCLDVEEIEKVIGSEPGKKYKENYYKARKRMIEQIKQWD